MPATVSKAISWTLDPVLLFLFLIVMTTVFASERRITIYLLLLIVGMGVAAFTPLPEFLMENLEQYHTTEGEVSFKEYAVVLGGDNIHIIKSNSQFNYSESFDRVGEALHLYRQKKISKIILTGGDVDYGGTVVNESTSSAKWLIAMGVSEADIITEEKSRSTLENASFVKEIVEARKIPEFYLITSASHMRRALGVFKKLGMNAVPFPVDYRVAGQNKRIWKYFGLGKLNLLKVAVHEYLGIAYYMALGYL